MTNREIRMSHNKFSWERKASRKRNDWKAKRKDRKQWLFDGKVKVYDYDDFARCNCIFYIPAECVDKRETPFMCEEEEYDV